MLRVTLRFPLGVYHARSNTDEAEWPPSPLRLVGALIAAAHGRQGVDPSPELALVQRLCEAPAPVVVAPDCVAVGEPTPEDEVVRLMGATRWAPVNYAKGSTWPQGGGRKQAAVAKSGVAIGDRPVAIVWRELELDTEELARFAVLAGDVSFVGTTRSPVVVEVDDAAPEHHEDAAAWTPAVAGNGGAFDALVRIPDPATIAAFDWRHSARRSRRSGVERGGMVPEIAIGTQARYASPRLRRTVSAAQDPRWWGDMIVLEVDRDRSETAPKAPAAYLLARAVRVALLGAYGEAGTADEAPPILRARGGDPHCAIVPLPSVGGPHPDGLLRGVAVLFPHEARLPDVHDQRVRVEHGLKALIGADSATPSRHVAIPGAGRIWLKLPDARAAQLVSLREDSYRVPATVWTTVTPIVHSRWRKGGVEAALAQLTADCAHVGLPAPEAVELLRTAGRRGGADRVLPPARVPEAWRGPLNGPTSHMRITFSQPVCGPVLIGRARHFGLGLCVPLDLASQHSVAA